MPRYGPGIDFNQRCHWINGSLLPPEGALAVKRSPLGSVVFTSRHHPACERPSGSCCTGNCSFFFIVRSKSKVVIPVKCEGLDQTSASRRKSESVRYKYIRAGLSDAKRRDGREVRSELTFWREANN